MNSKLRVLLSTYDGEEYLDQQLFSLTNQTYKDFKILARDDNSNDKTMEILNSYNVEVIHTNENIGPKNSFSILLNNALQTNNDYFMFCDQDDVWKNDKIEKTMQKMQEMEKKFPGKPILIHTDLEVVDKNLNNINPSMWHYAYLKPELNSLNRLLMQNTITGCTIMINKRLTQLALPVPNEAIMHDWWLGLVASQFGKIAYLDESTIKYRQHSSNSIGVKGFNFISIFLKFYKNELHLKHLQVVKQAKAFLNTYKNKLDSSTIQMLEDFATISQKSFLEKRKILLKHRLLKQGVLRNFGLLLKI